MRKGFLNSTVKPRTAGGPSHGTNVPPSVTVDGATPHDTSPHLPTGMTKGGTSIESRDKSSSYLDSHIDVPPASSILSLEALPAEATIKPTPFHTSSAAPLKHHYSPSPSGVDSNLLILFHGLGDNSLPFFNLGRRLQTSLPQTAILALQGTHPIPWLTLPNEEARHFSYWQAIDSLGETLPPAQQELGRFLEVFEELMEELKNKCGWPTEAIHLFGFGHGATAALEAAVYWVRAERTRGRQGKLGSIVAVCGGLLSFPTFSPPVPAPILYFHRPRLHNGSSPSPHVLAYLQRAFLYVTDLPFASDKGASQKEEGEEERMPSSQKEWDSIMSWWSERGRWRNRGTWELQDRLSSAHGEGEVPESIFRVV